MEITTLDNDMKLDIDSINLTRSERRVAELVLSGLSNKECADKLFANEKNIKYHLTSIFKKAKVENRLQLAVKYESKYLFPSGASTFRNSLINNEENLSNYVEAISDDFGSTFTVVDKNTLTNMLGLTNDFDLLNKIIQKYIPTAKISFIKTDQLDSEYDIYLVRLVRNN